MRVADRGGAYLRYHGARLARIVPGYRVIAGWWRDRDSVESRSPHRSRATRVVEARRAARAAASEGITGEEAQEPAVPSRPE